MKKSRKALSYDRYSNRSPNVEQYNDNYFTRRGIEEYTQDESASIEKQIYKEHIKKSHYEYLKSPSPRLNSVSKSRSISTERYRPRNKSIEYYERLEKIRGRSRERNRLYDERNEDSDFRYERCNNESKSRKSHKRKFSSDSDLSSISRSKSKSRSRSSSRSVIRFRNRANSRMKSNSRSNSINRYRKRSENNRYDERDHHYDYDKRDYRDYDKKDYYYDYDKKDRRWYSNERNWRNYTTPRYSNRHREKNELSPRSFSIERERSRERERRRRKLQTE